VKVLNVTVGDFVLVRRAGQRNLKLAFSGFGPRRVEKVKSDHVVEVENLVSGRRDVGRARRLILYRADMDGKDVDPAPMRAVEHSEPTY